MRKIALITVVVMLLGLLAACGAGSSNDGGSTNSNSGNNQQKNAQLNVAVVDGPGAVALRELANEYKELTGVTVNVNGYSYTDIHQKQVLDFTGRTGAIDIMGIAYQWYGEYLSGTENLVPLDDFINSEEYTSINLDNYSDAVLDVYSKYDGKIYGLPFIGDVELLAYNKRMVEEAGVTLPTTWAELAEVGKELTLDTDGDGKIDQYGFGLMGGRGGQSAGTFTNIFYSLGGTYLDDENVPQFDTPEALETMELIANELTEISPEDSSTWDFGENVNAFIQGSTAMALFWTGGASATVDPEQSNVVDEVEFAAFPANSSLLGGWSLAINSYSKNIDAAYEFLAWFASEEIQKKYAELGGAPVAISALTDPELIEKYPWFPMMKEALEVAKAFPRIPQSEKLLGAMSEEVNDAVTKTKTPEEAVQSLQKRAIEIMAE